MDGVRVRFIMIRSILVKTCESDNQIQYSRLVSKFQTCRIECLRLADILLECVIDAQNESFLSVHDRYERVRALLTERIRLIHTEHDVFGC